MTTTQVSAAYASEVHDYLTVGKNATRSPKEHPLLSEAEGEEMVQSYLLNVPAKTFAARLEQRDLKAFEATCT